MMRIGFAKDIHITSTTCPLYLGGVLLDEKIGLSSHSDGDIVLHAVAESILGALALGDLGTFFPDNDDKYKGYESSKIVKYVVELMKKKKFHIANIDISIEFETVRLKKYIELIRTSVASLLETDLSNVSVKAMTNEKMDATGNGKAAIAYAVVLLEE